MQLQQSQPLRQLLHCGLHVQRSVANRDPATQQADYSLPGNTNDGLKEQLMEINVLSLCFTPQELKQDISSFRYEVMGMMKTGKPALPGGKAGGSSADCSSSLEEPPGPHGSQVKSKLNRFKIIASILKQGSSLPSLRPPEASNGLPNGVLSTGPDESSCEGPRRDISDFDLFQKHQPGTGAIPRQMCPLPEEAAESGGREQQAERGERLLETPTEEERDEKGVRSSDEGATEKIEEDLPRGN